MKAIVSLLFQFFISDIWLPLSSHEEGNYTVTAIHKLQVVSAERF